MHFTAYIIIQVRIISRQVTVLSSPHRSPACSAVLRACLPALRLSYRAEGCGLRGSSASPLLSFALHWTAAPLSIVVLAAGQWETAPPLERVSMLISSPLYSPSLPGESVHHPALWYLPLAWTPKTSERPSGSDELRSLPPTDPPVWDKNTHRHILGAVSLSERLWNLSYCVLLYSSVAKEVTPCLIEEWSTSVVTLGLYRGEQYNTEMTIKSLESAFINYAFNAVAICTTHSVQIYGKHANGKIWITTYAVWYMSTQLLYN